MNSAYMYNYDFCSLVNDASYYTFSCQHNSEHYLLTYNQTIKGT